MPRRATDTRSVLIAAGTSLSAEVSLEGFDLMAVKIPAAWTTAGLSFKAAEKTGGTFDPVTDAAGAEITITAAAGKQLGLSLGNRESVMCNEIIKLVSGTNAVPVNQVADRTIILVLKRSGGSRE